MNGLRVFGCKFSLEARLARSKRVEQRMDFAGEPTPYVSFAILKYGRTHYCEDMKRARRLLIVAAFLALLLLPIYEAQGQDYVEYNVRINDDGSAAWRIIHVSDINAPLDSWAGFQQRILDLVDSAASTSHREMSLD